MNNDGPSTIRVRYGIHPIMVISLTGLMSAAFSPPPGAVLIPAIFLPFVIAVSVRPFLLVAADGARFVSLISDEIFRSISKEELFIRLPTIRWLLRKSDLALLTGIEKLEQTAEIQS
jgi:hypothetical protein